MEGQSGSRSTCSRPRGSEADSRKKKIPDRVTLKKEIGLLSACTIIIGESGKLDSDQFFLCHVSVKFVFGRDAAAGRTVRTESQLPADSRSQFDGLRIGVERTFAQVPNIIRPGTRPTHL